MHPQGYRPVRHSACPLPADRAVARLTLGTRGRGYDKCVRGNRLRICASDPSRGARDSRPFARQRRARCCTETVQRHAQFWSRDSALLRRIRRGPGPKPASPYSVPTCWRPCCSSRWPCWRWRRSRCFPSSPRPSPGCCFGGGGTSTRKPHRRGGVTSIRDRPGRQGFRLAARLNLGARARSPRGRRLGAASSVTSAEWQGNQGRDNRPLRIGEVQRVLPAMGSSTRARMAPAAYENVATV